MAANGVRRRDPRKRSDFNQRNKTDSGEPSHSINVDESSPIIQAFRQYQMELDCTHDKYERLVKLSRDITIESKRAIFMLHRITGNESSKASVLQQTEDKLHEIRQTKFLPIAKELKNEDLYLYLRAVSPGFQEYVEAVAFFWYLSHGNLISLSQIDNDLQFTVSIDSAGSESVQAHMEVDVSEPQLAGIKNSDQAEDRNSPPSRAMEAFRVQIPPMEYMLGIADLTGELMRMAIMSVGAGNLSIPFHICNLIRIIYDGFVSFGNVSRDTNRKVSVLRNSLQKVENACYTIQVRGSEVPKHMLADLLSRNTVSGSEFPDENTVVDD